MVYANYKPPTRAKHHVDLGQRFGKLVVTELDLRLEPKNSRRSDGRKRSAERAVRVRCDCGTEKIIKMTNLINPKTQQSQCNRCMTGMNTRVRENAQYLYHLHRNMLGRCYNPKHNSFKNYGARGVRVAAAWHDYETFRSDVLREIGERPEGMSFDRIRVDGDYEPGNVRWATTQEQQNNKRTSRLYPEQVAEAKRRYDRGGVTYRDLADELGVSEHSLYVRVMRLREQG